MADFVVDTSELQRLGQNAAAAKAAMPGEMQRAMTRSVLQIEADAKGLTPVDTGNLRRSITHEVTATGDGVIGKVGSNAPYAEIVHEGRNPGKMPPEGALLGWMGRHGIDAKMEYVVRRAINSRKGKATKFFEKALQQNKAALEKEFAQVVPRVLRLLGGR